MGLSTNQLSVFCKESKIGTDYIYICFTHISIHIGICIQQIDVAGFLLNLPVLSNPSSTLDQSDVNFMAAETHDTREKDVQPSCRIVVKTCVS